MAEPTPTERARAALDILDAKLRQSLGNQYTTAHYDFGQEPIARAITDAQNAALEEAAKVADELDEYGFYSIGDAIRARKVGT